IVINSLTHFHSVNHGEWLFNKDVAKLKLGKKARAPFSYTLLSNPAEFSKWVQYAEDALLVGCDIETNQHGMKKSAKSSSRVPCFNEVNMDIEGLGETWITCVSFCMLMPDLTMHTAVLPMVEGDQDFWLSDENYGKAIQ